ncbi:hypothetical protein EON66_08935 [archaeon]|nr:MAG: hypothetical protein EON66_08935 [archaeon]
MIYSEQKVPSAAMFFSRYAVTASVPPPVDPAPMLRALLSWLQGELVYWCRQCGADGSCVLCASCFAASNHTGHDVTYHACMLYAA